MDPAHILLLCSIWAQHPHRFGTKACPILISSCPAENRVETLAHRTKPLLASCICCWLVSLSEALLQSASDQCLFWLPEFSAPETLGSYTPHQWFLSLIAWPLATLCILAFIHLLAPCSKSKLSPISSKACPVFSGSKVYSLLPAQNYCLRLDPVSGFPKRPVLTLNHCTFSECILGSLQKFFCCLLSTVNNLTPQQCSSIYVIHLCLL